MSEIFGSKGKTAGGGVKIPKAPGANRTGNEYVSFDNDSGEMVFHLPPHLAQYRAELAVALQEEFFLTMPGEETANSIAEFIDEWVAARSK